VAWQLGNVAADCFQLPAEPLDNGRILIQSQQPVNETRYDVGAKRQASRDIVLLLSLEPSPLEEWLMAEHVG
jgi:hypothetical protein